MVMTRLLYPFVVSCIAALLTACGVGTTPSAGDVDGSQQGAVIADRYIVTLNEGLVPGGGPDFGLAVAAIAREFGLSNAQPLGIINGFVATADQGHLRRLERDPRVLEIEPDRVVTIVTTTQSNPPSWGVDRLDQRARPLDKAYTYDSTGSGVRAYIVDTGIRSTHTEFGGRVLPGYTSFNDGYGTEDCHSHGTHVAGTVGGATVGVAKTVFLVPVRVMNCSGSGSYSGIIAGLDWIAATHVKPAVANLSIGGGVSSSLNRAVDNLHGRGVLVVVSAGNSNADACTQSPASAQHAYTVGATTSTDARASYSNWGTCVDLFAPGSSIVSAVHTSDTATGTKSGTSMSSPHVAGAAARYLQAHPAATPTQVKTALSAAATSGIVSGAGTGSPNLLLFTALDLPQPTPEPTLEPTPEPAPQPEPEPVPCSYCGTHTGNITRAGRTALVPGSGGFTAEAGNVIDVTLTGPQNANFDLALEYRNGKSWVVVASSSTPDSNEALRYVAAAGGSYRVAVRSVSGTGSFTVVIGN
jgi:aqualysin 1